MHSTIMIMPTITKEANSVLNHKVIALMKNDECSIIIRNDSLIKSFGSVLVDKLMLALGLTLMLMGGLNYFLLPERGAY